MRSTVADLRRAGLGADRQIPEPGLPVGLLYVVGHHVPQGLAGLGGENGGPLFLGGLSKGQEDENGILFVCFPVTAIAAVLSRSSMTVKRSLNELEIAGLIMRVRQGVGEPNRIYVLMPGKEDAALA